MTGASDSEDAARQQLEAKLSGLERLRLSGLVTAERYEAMKAKLLADAGIEVASTPPPPAPPPAPRWTPAPAAAAPEPPPPATADAPPPAAAAPPPPPPSPAEAPAPAAAAPPPTPPQAAPPAPPPSTAPTAPRPAFPIPMLAAAGIGVLILVAAVVAVVASRGHSSPAATAAGAHSSPSASAPAPTSPTPTGTPDLSAFGDQYVAVITPLNQAWAGFTNALDNAQSAPCTCPAGHFDARTVVPYYFALIRAYQDTINALQTMQQELGGGKAQADTQALLQDMERTSQSMQATFSNPNPSNAVVALFGTDFDIEHAAALALRADLGLPSPSP